MVKMPADPNARNIILRKMQKSWPILCKPRYTKYPEWKGVGSNSAGEGAIQKIMNQFTIHQNFK